jgi:cobyrinic acid a,c-diamide synthase
MPDSVHCPAVLVSGPASGQGKTSVAAALSRSQLRRGRRVQVFKTGPDFIDPTILECASRRSVHQLDLFMGGDSHCRSLLHQAAIRSDLIVVEGAMGLFDGAPSSADLAAEFNLPLAFVRDSQLPASSPIAWAVRLMPGWSVTLCRMDCRWSAECRSTPR